MTEPNLTEEEIWKDLTPIFNSEEESAVVPISYSPDFTLAFARLRACLQSNEISQRALDLTQECAELNAANYTMCRCCSAEINSGLFSLAGGNHSVLMEYRRKLLKDLEKPPHEELTYISAVIEDSAKNYQVWHHRKSIVEWLNDGSKEKHFTERILLDDNKNYHAWQHRQWVVERFNLWDGELDWTEKMLNEDLRNNSVWNHRYFVLTTTASGVPDGNKLAGRLSEEIKFAQKYILQGPHNESAWNYLNGILMDDGLCKHPEVLKFVETLLAETKEPSNHSIAFLVDYNMEKLEENPNDADRIAKINKNLDAVIKIDPIRKNYWNSLRV